jgi:hypothetical protein
VRDFIFQSILICERCDQEITYPPVKQEIGDECHFFCSTTCKENAHEAGHPARHLRVVR